MNRITDPIKEKIGLIGRQLLEKTGGSKKKLYAVITAAVIILLIIISAIIRIVSGIAGGGKLPGGMSGRQGGASQQASYTVVRTETPHYGNISVTSSLTGTVEASDVVHITARASGDVTSVDVQAGDYVEAGQLLMTINTNQVESARNSLESAEVSLNSAKNDLSRMQILYDGGDITAQEYETYQNKYKTAQLSYDSAQLSYEKQLSYSEITAPISGRVESIGVDVYDNVNTNAELAVISGEGNQKTTVYVSERIMNALRTGDELKAVKNGKEYSGRITEISTIVDSETGLFKVKAELENNDEIATGSTVKIILTSDRSENVMLVPVDAVYYSGGQSYVYVIEDGTASTRFVEIGLYDDTNAEIKSGLGEDELVVSTWSSNLYEGAKVRLYEDLVAGETSEENAEENSAEKAAGKSEGLPDDRAASKGENSERGQQGGRPSAPDGEVSENKRPAQSYSGLPEQNKAQ